MIVALVSDPSSATTGRRVAFDAVAAEVRNRDLQLGLQENVAEQYGASRIPVRGALSILEADGLVKLVANSGA
ncbi:GntR family transcriptional regulator [Amycolatopsis jejuensis]|uniref:GntR family transcriptional regulator n=1 Tax=Amycolatopsis jejuensis TaxID=330084 RepID=UPI003CCBD208